MRQAMAGVVVVGAIVAISSFGMVRAENATPNSSHIFRCNSGVTCLGGHSTGHPAGVVGISATGDGVIAESGGSNEAALRAHAEGRRTYIFVGHNPTNMAYCTMDPSANLSCTGNIGAGSTIQSTHRNSQGQRVLAYASQSATATIEDVGTARMAGGVSNVRIDPAFAAIVDGRWYYVFVTPLGETRGLYVVRKTALGFQVRENERGRANVDFDYRIVAHPIDASTDRLPIASGDPSKLDTP
ncbi:MAG: hypothetical protein WBX26_11650 [Candidatus Cybelea sp.]